MANLDIIKVPKLKPKKEKRRIHLRWWEGLILVLLGLFLVEVVYFYFVAAKVKDKVFQPKTSSAGLIADIGLSGNKALAKNAYKDYTTFLFLGIGGDGHDGGALTDSIQVVALNNKTNELKIVSIPRDLYLKLDACGEGKINQMYECGEVLWGSGGGGDFSKSIVNQVLNVPIDYYVQIDFTGFREFIDDLGGIDVKVDKAINDDLAGINVSPGLVHMDGTMALAYARTRSLDSDFDRSARQQEIILAIRKKILSTNIYLNPVKLYKFFDILANNLTTDLNAKSSFSYLRNLKNIKQIGTYVIDNRKDDLLYATTSDEGSYILLPKDGNFSAVAAKVKKIILDK